MITFLYSFSVYRKYSIHKHLQLTYAYHTYIHTHSSILRLRSVSPIHTTSDILPKDQLQYGIYFHRN